MILRSSIQYVGAENAFNSFLQSYEITFDLNFGEKRVIIDKKTDKKPGIMTSW